MKRRSFVAAVTMAVSVLASTSTSVQAQMPAAGSTEVDITALAGKWEGWWIGAESSPLEVTVRADGTYVSRRGADGGSGTFRVVKGVIVTEGDLSGGDAPWSHRTAIVRFVQKKGAAMLTGDGRTSAGAYSFTLTK
jgi:hypothetical protein